MQPVGLLQERVCVCGGLSRKDMGEKGEEKSGVTQISLKVPLCPHLHPACHSPQGNKPGQTRRRWGELCSADLSHTSAL